MTRQVLLDQLDMHFLPSLHRDCHKPGYKVDVEKKIYHIVHWVSQEEESFYCAPGIIVHKIH